MLSVWTSQKAVQLAHVSRVFDESQVQAFMRPKIPVLETFLCLSKSPMSTQLYLREEIGIGIVPLSSPPPSVTMVTNKPDHGSVEDAKPLRELRVWEPLLAWMESFSAKLRPILTNTHYRGCFVPGAYKRVRPRYFLFRPTFF
ncbi:hypothetical protein AVEN_202298-1 [Araneus ventricosus]|uniref:Uncharacterized protein n=1 Tax=Araneus ventricosus TaxID=182803 RepID=A0A4Y2I2I1_ARAVE|nr:hypothetical protein AVEN_202298-1 [Araneus ventricosus]